MVDTGLGVFGSQNLRTLYTKATHLTKDLFVNGYGVTDMDSTYTTDGTEHELMIWNAGNKDSGWRLGPKTSLKNGSPIYSRYIHSASMKSDENEDCPENVQEWQERKVCHKPR